MFSELELDLHVVLRIEKKVVLLQREDLRKINERGSTFSK